MWYTWNVDNGLDFHDIHDTSIVIVIRLSLEEVFSFLECCNLCDVNNSCMTINKEINVILLVLLFVLRSSSNLWTKEMRLAYQEEAIPIRSSAIEDHVNLHHWE